MPVYDATGLGPTPKLLLPGEPGYLFGSLPYDQAPARFTVTNVALTSNVATVTIQIEQGNIPAVGNLVSIRATTSTGGIFNVTNAVLTGATITATTGAGTITFALTHADVVSAADTGYGIIPVAETAEALIPTGGVVTTAPLAIARNQAHTNVERTINCYVSFPSLPTTATVTLQGAIRDYDSEYVAMGSAIATVTGGVLTLALTQYSLTNVNFIRAQITGITASSSPAGVAGTAVIKVL